MLGQKYGNGKWIGLTLSVCRGCLSYFHFAPFLFIMMLAVCGVLADLSAGGTVGFFAVAFTLVCFAQASLLGTYLNRNLPTAAVVSLGSSAAVLSLYFLLFRAFAGAPDSAALYFFGYLPRVLYTAMTFVPLYGLNRLITKRL